MKPGDIIETQFGKREVKCECNSEWHISSPNQEIPGGMPDPCQVCLYDFWFLKDEIEPSQPKEKSDEA